MTFFVGLMQVRCMPKHVFKKKARLFFQVMCKTMAECIYKTFVRHTKIPWRFQKDIYYIFQTIEKNYALKPKSGCWKWFVNFENDRFVDNMGDIENFESVDSFDLHILFGEIGSDEFVEEKNCNNMVKEEKKSDLLCEEKEIIIEKNH